MALDDKTLRDIKCLLAANRIESIIDDLIIYRQAVDEFCVVRGIVLNPDNVYKSLSNASSAESMFVSCVGSSADDVRREDHKKLVTMCRRLLDAAWNGSISTDHSLKKEAAELLKEVGGDITIRAIDKSPF